MKCTFVPWVNTVCTFTGPLVLRCRLHPNICGESFRFFCIMLLHLYVSICKLKIELFISQFQLLDLSIPLPVSLVLWSLWGIWTYNNIGIFQNISGVFLLFSLNSSASDFSEGIWFFFHIWIVSRGAVSPVVFFVCVGINVVLHVSILALKEGPFLFHSPTSVIYLCIIFLPSLWLPFIHLIVLLLGVSMLFHQIFYPKFFD